MSDLEQRIKEAAEKATQGEWELHSSNSWWRIGTTEKDGSIVRPTNHLLDDHPDLAAREADLEWIALASPANILALLAEKDAEIERLTRERDEWKLMTRRYQLHFGVMDLKEPRP